MFTHRSQNGVLVLLLDVMRLVTDFLALKQFQTVTTLCWLCPAQTFSLRTYIFIRGVFQLNSEIRYTNFNLEKCIY